MVNTVDFSKSWVIQYPGLVKNEYPLSITREDGAVSFTIPLNLKEQIEFQLKDIEEDSQKIVGSYKVLPSGQPMKIILEVLESGKLIKGTLQGDLSRFSISLKRKD